jgi:hypothetical protein
MFRGNSIDVHHHGCLAAKFLNNWPTTDVHILLHLEKLALVCPDYCRYSELTVRPDKLPASTRSNTYSRSSSGAKRKRFVEINA